MKMAVQRTSSLSLARNNFGPVGEHKQNLKIVVGPANVGPLSKKPAETADMTKSLRL